jgi:hypothetical protein
MTHRAGQIVELLVTTLQDASIVSAQNVYAHRSLSLADDQSELPAICVNFGEDTRIAEFGNATEEDAQIDSVLTAVVTLYAVGVDEATVSVELLRMRELSHVAILTDPTLGEEFIVVIRYGGASAPIIDSSSGVFAGQLVTPFFVHYRMSAANPAT